MQTLGDLAFARTSWRQALVKDAVLVLGGSLLTTLCAKIQAPTTPVPITMQPFAVLLVGAALGGRRGGLAMLVYLLQGFAGIPVFVGPIAGPAYFAGPTAGYLLSFPTAAFLVGSLAECGWDRRFLTAAAAMAFGNAVILAMGFAWLAVFVGPAKAVAVGVAPFVIGDALKVLLAATALPTAWRLIGQRG